MIWILFMQSENFAVGSTALRICLTKRKVRGSSRSLQGRHLEGQRYRIRKDHCRGSCKSRVRKIGFIILKKGLRDGGPLFLCFYSIYDQILYICTSVIKIGFPEIGITFSTGKSLRCNDECRYCQGHYIEEKVDCLYPAYPA